MAEYEDFLTATRYGYVDGLKGVNCRHDFFPVFPWMKPKYSDEELRQKAEQEAEKRKWETKDRAGRKVVKELNSYEATQEMRKMERLMRDTRARAEAYKAGGNEEAYTEAKARYMSQRVRYKQFTDKMKLAPQFERVYMDGLGRI